MKTYYELLGLEPAAEPDAIKRAFRREIARYHPDKVQHLGPEFQEIASTRAAELTEAYRVLMDAAARAQYDESLLSPVQPSPPPPPAPPHPAAPPDPVPPRAPAPDRKITREQVTSTQFVRRAVIAKLTEACTRVGGAAVAEGAFDAVYDITPRRSLFRKAEPPVRLAAKVVSQVDSESLAASWTDASRMASRGQTVCLMLLGSTLAPAKDLSATVSELRRKTRHDPPIVIPVDIRDWEALVPPQTPPLVRALLERLQRGE
ncbi:MAG TPA: J domain-containing protein [Vicinamibacterales bacterium]|nr:J domain-containing protein [Vicinamibacterales bacterium]